MLADGDEGDVEDDAGGGDVACVDRSSASAGCAGDCGQGGHGK